MIEAKDIKSLLIIKPSSLGDIINTFPAVDLIAKIAPEVSLSWLINPEFVEILAYSPLLENAILFKRRTLAKPLKFPLEFYKLLSRLNRKKWDLAIDFQGLLRSSTIAKLSNAKRIAGFACPKEKLSGLFYNIKIDTDKFYLHAAEKNCALVNTLFNCDFDVKRYVSSYVLPVQEQYRESVSEKLKQYNIPENSVIIAIVPGARWQTKQWPAEFFANVITDILSFNKNIYFCILGSDNEKKHAEKIISLLKYKQTVINLTGETSVCELVELLRICKCAITNDSGPMHIAAALHKKVFALFGPTDPKKTGPYGADNTVLQPDISCIKCMKRTCAKYDRKCHSGIDPEKVSSIVCEYIVSVGKVV